MIGKIHRRRAALGFFVQRRTRLHIGRDIGDGHPQPPAARRLAGIDGIVEIARVGPVDGDQRQVAQVGAVFLVFFGHRVAKAFRFGQRLGRPFIGNAVRAHGDIDFHARRHAITQHFDHGTDGLHALGRRLDDTHGDHLVVGRAVAIGLRHADIVGNTRVVGDHVADTTLLDKAADHGVVDPLEHFGHAPFPTPAVVAADDAHHRAVAVHEQAHLARVEEHVVLLAVVGNEKAEAVPMALYAPAHQVHLVQRAQGAAAVFEQLAVAQHGAQAMLERLGGIAGQGIKRGEFGPGHGPARVGQVVEHELAAGYGFGVAAFFVFELRIAVAPVGTTARFLIQDVAPYARTIP